MIERGMRCGLIVNLTGMFVLFILGCSSDVIMNKKNDYVDMNQYKTFAFLPSAGVDENQFEEKPLVATAAIDKIIYEMNRQDYRLDPKNPDLLVLVHVKYNKWQDFTTVPAGYTYHGVNFSASKIGYIYCPCVSDIEYISGNLVKPAMYTQGTMVVDLIDTRKKEIVWRGEARVPSYKNPSSKKQMVQNVKKIFGDGRRTRS